MILADFSISFKVIENAMTTKPSVYENMKKINQMLFTVNISHEHNQTQEFPALVILCESVVVCVRACAQKGSMQCFGEVITRTFLPLDLV